MAGAPRPDPQPKNKLSISINPFPVSRLHEPICASSNLFWNGWSNLNRRGADGYLLFSGRSIVNNFEARPIDRNRLKLPLEGLGLCRPVEEFTLQLGHISVAQKWRRKLNTRFLSRSRRVLPVVLV